MQFKPLSANPTKWSNTLKQFVWNLPTNCQSVFDHSMALVLKGLNSNAFSKIQDFVTLKQKRIQNNCMDVQILTKLWLVFQSPADSLYPLLQMIINTAILICFEKIYPLNKGGRYVLILQFKFWFKVDLIRCGNDRHDPIQEVFNKCI